MCPRECGKDRLRGELGTCKVGRHAAVSSAFAHLGEEDPIRGHSGSGTIFFARCNLLCRFCQNWETSHEGEGAVADAHSLAAVMLALQAQGCHNTNLVTPSHVVPQLLEALAIAVRGGLSVPIVFNTGGYDSLDTLRLLDGVVDIYMPDLKTLDADRALRWFDAPDYPERASEALIEMQRQVGDLRCDAAGIATRGLLVRHLVMPGAAGDSEAVMRFLAQRVSRRCHVNVMEQYRPLGDARRDPELGKRPAAAEFAAARSAAKARGLALV
jgi:putative pyruvate formate lyase activating enzyme